jgi:1-acyl-sn-glycerol-3-phosphate acyltransferase
MAEEYGGLRSNLKADGWTVLGITRVALIICASVPLFSYQYLMVKLSRKNWWAGAALWHRTMCRLVGIEVRIKGGVEHGGPVLYAANHISWLDIIVLGGHLKNASFIAKSEMAGWGFLGSICSLHKTIFVNRERRSEAKRQANELVSRVHEGHSLILFPEGTSTDGMKVVKFKSSLFSVAELADEASDHTLLIQPITLAFTEVNGMPIVRSKKPLVAWLGDVELFDHLRQFLGLARTVATVEFHAPVTLAEAGGRKQLATYCEGVVRSGLERAHRHEMKLGPRALDQLETVADGVGA